TYRRQAPPRRVEETGLTDAPTRSRLDSSTIGSDRQGPTEQRAVRQRAGGGMNSFLETPETKPSTTEGGAGKTLGIAAVVATRLAVVALGLAAYLFVGLRDARREIAQLTEAASSA